MSLHNGLDTVAIATVGVFTKTFGAAAQKNICNLFASLGLLEDAPDTTGLYRKVRGLIGRGFKYILGG